MSGQAQKVQSEPLDSAGKAHQKYHWNQARVIHGVSIGGNDDAGYASFALSEKCEAGGGTAYYFNLMLHFG
ncbi:hypothetical protein C7534_11679 [Pseudomonas sp. OV226]|jgi:hypothetical protein|nr:hypothetical protein C7534_11679 [Pseudomonas sp. OV226]